MTVPAAEKDLGNALGALATTGKRAKIHDAQMVFKLPKQVKDLVEEYAEAQETSAGTIVRFAVAEYFERRGFRS